MSWWEANQGRRQNIARSVENINQTIADMARLREQRAARTQGLFSDMAGSLENMLAAKKGRQFTTSERLAGEAFQKERDAAELASQKELEQYRRNLEQAKTDDERNYWWEKIRPWEEEQTKKQQEAAIRQASAGRSQQNINTDLREARINAEDDWLVALRIQNPTAVGQDGTPIPASLTDKDRASLISFYMDIPGVDEGKATLWADRFLGQLKAGGVGGAGAGAGMEGAPRFPRGTPAAEILLQITPEQKQAKESLAGQIQQYVNAIQSKVEQLRATPQAEPEERAFSSWLRDLNADISRGHGGGLMGMSEGALTRILDYVTKMAQQYGLSINPGALKESVRVLK